MTKIRILSLTLFMVVLIGQRAAHAVGAEDYRLSYTIYAGGLEALSADYSVQETADHNLEVKVEAETAGFIGSLFPWQGRYTTTGAYQGDIFVPASHKSVSIWRDTPKKKEILFNDNGEITAYIERENGKTARKDDFTAKLTDNAVDLLSAVMIAFRQVENADTCNTAATAFDGKRKFNIQFTDGEKDYINPSKYSMYDGEALKCTLTVVPVAGFSEKDQHKGWMAVQNHTSERGKLPEIWFARLEQGGPLVPVRMEINSAYGGVIAHLTNIDTPGIRNLAPAAGE